MASKAPPQKPNGIPGPGSYKPAYENVITSAPVATMASKPPQSKPNEIPGPGAYKVESTASNRAAVFTSS